MPCTVEMVDVRLAQPLDAVAADQLRQALAVQNIEDHERPAPRAHLFHRWVIELAPFHRELDRVDMGDALPPGEGRELAADACAPVHHGAEDVEQAGADVHRTQSYRLVRTVPGRQRVRVGCFPTACVRDRPYHAWMLHEL